MTKFSLFLTAVLLFTPMAAQAQAPFTKGEVIHYNVKQMGIKAGEATLKFAGDTYRDGQKYTLVIFTARGFAFFDEERIFLDMATLLPKIVMRDLNISGKKENIMEEYFQDKGLVRVTKMLGDQSSSVVELKKKGPIENIYGFLYRLRMKGPVAIGMKMDLNLPTVNIVLEAKKEVPLEVAGQRVTAVMLKSVPDKYTLWFDKTEKVLPLRIAGALGFSNTVMTFVRVDYEKEAAFSEKE
ncbi:MAG: DUF3108 domain-containing protein [Candidatus Omnitrophica bacterium]|nr:DUF3108 domain-containing protein [Candidatus Omnitrophota bacterium]